MICEVIFTTQPSSTAKRRGVRSDWLLVSQRGQRLKSASTTPKACCCAGISTTTSAEPGPTARPAPRRRLRRLHDTPRPSDPGDGETAPAAFGQRPDLLRRRRHDHPQRRGPSRHRRGTGTVLSQSGQHPFEDFFGKRRHDGTRRVVQRLGPHSAQRAAHRGHVAIRENRHAVASWGSTGPVSKCPTPPQILPRSYAAGSTFGVEAGPVR